MRTNRKDCAITWTALLVCVLCRSAFGQSATPLNLSVMTFEFPRRRTAEQQFLYRRFLLHG